MNNYERALIALTGLEALAEERREAIAARILIVIEESHGGHGMSEEEIGALDEELRSRVGSDEEIEAVFRNLLR